MIAPLLLIFAQVGPAPGGFPLEPLPIPRAPAAPASAPAPAVPADPRLATCLRRITADAAAGEQAARGWVAELPNSAAAHHCLGIALAAREQWAAAGANFVEGRSRAAEPAYRARLGILAAAAISAGGEREAALPLLVEAEGEARTAGATELLSAALADRAALLVELERLAEARSVLARARADLPRNAPLWLLSATLERRLGSLDTAQALIVEAAGFAPGDPEIGLEAGVIAMLAGDENAARLSWQSVIAVAPGSEAAGIAQGYLAQLPPAPATPALGR